MKTCSSYATRPDDPVLKKFNLKMSSHKVIALVGASGNGKSTIASLLARMYDPRGGKITIDGVDIRNLDPKWLRGELIGYVGQVILFLSVGIIIKPGASAFYWNSGRQHSLRQSRRQ